MGLNLPIADVGYTEAAWVMVVKSAIIFLGVFAIVLILTVAERKLIGRFQNRYWPNRVGPVGLMPLADILKLAGKEMFRLQAAVLFLFAIAPAIVIFSGIVTLAILPSGNVQDGIGLYGIDVSIGVLYFLAFGLLSFYGLLLAGWSGLEVQLPRRDAVGRPADLLRGLDGPVAAGRGDDDRLLSLTAVVDGQGEVWNVLPQIVGFLIFRIAGFAETNRAPFDLPEADAEPRPGPA